jgi:hypothetical protein
MEEHRDERIDAGYRLMMDMYSRQMEDMARPSRWWIRLGMMIVALAGGVGLLLAIGHRTHETPDSRGTLVSTSRDPASRLQTKGLQERADLLGPSSVSQEETFMPDQPQGGSDRAVIQPSSGSQAGRGSRGLSASPTVPRHPKASSARSSLLSPSKRMAECSEKNCRHREVRPRSIQLSQRSLRDEFDPNAARVLSTD